MVCYYVVNLVNRNNSTGEHDQRGLFDIRIHNRKSKILQVLAYTEPLKHQWRIQKSECWLVRGRAGRRQLDAKSIDGMGNGVSISRSRLQKVWKSAVYFSGRKHVWYSRSQHRRLILLGVIGLPIRFAHNKR